MKPVRSENYSHAAWSANVRGKLIFSGSAKLGPWIHRRSRTRVAPQSSTPASDSCYQPLNFPRCACVCDKTHAYLTTRVKCRRDAVHRAAVTLTPRRRVADDAETSARVSSFWGSRGSSGSRPSSPWQCTLP